MICTTHLGLAVELGTFEQSTTRSRARTPCLQSHMQFLRVEIDSMLTQTHTILTDDNVRELLLIKQLTQRKRLWLKKTKGLSTRTYVT